MEMSSNLTFIVDASLRIIPIIMATRKAMSHIDILRLSRCSCLLKPSCKGGRAIVLYLQHMECHEVNGGTNNRRETKRD